MSHVVDFSAVGQDNASTSLTTPVPSNYEVGDLLVYWAMKDGSGGTVTGPSGWTETVGSGGLSSTGHRAYCYHKIAAASESDPTITSTNSNEWSGMIIAIRGVDQTTPIDVTASLNSTTGSGPVQFPSVTTTSADQLVLFLGSNDARERNPRFDNSGVMVIHRRQDTQSALIAGWTIQKAAAALDNPPSMNLRVSDDKWLLTIAIKNAAGSYIPPHLDMDTQPYEEINQMNFTGGYADVTTDFSSINGQTTLHVAPTFIHNNGLNAGYATTIFLESVIADEALTSGYDFSSDKDFDGKLLLIHCQYNTPVHAERGGASNITGGQFLGFYSDSKANATFWTINANNLAPSGAGSWLPVVIKLNNPNNIELDEFGTGVDPAAVEGLVIGSNRTDASGVALKANFFKLIELNKFVCIGGSSSTPFTLKTFFDAAFSTDIASVFSQNQQANSQFFSLMPVVVGNSSYPSYFSARYQTLEFAKVAEQHVNHQFMAENGDLYFELDLSSSDEADLRNSTFNMNGHTWRIKSGSSTSATYQFGGHTILNGLAQLQNIGAAISGMSFVQCKPVELNGADLSGGCTFDNTSGDHAIKVTSQANIDDLANCEFINNSVAIQVDVAGNLTLDLDNIKFSGNTTDIEYTGSGTLTINNTNGANAVTSSVTGDGAVVINNSVSVSITALDSGDSSAIENARVYIVAGSGGPLTAGTVIYNDLTNASGQISTSINYTADQPITGRIRKSTSSPFYKTFDIIGTITSSGFSLTASMLSDE